MSRGGGCIITLGIWYNATMKPTCPRGQIPPHTPEEALTVLELPEGGFQVSVGDLTASGETLEEAFCRLQRLRKIVSSKAQSPEKPQPES